MARKAADGLAANRAPTMAAALTYRTLFSLPPVIVLAGVTARAFLGRERILDLASQSLSALGADQIGVSGVVADTGTAATGAPAASTLSQWMLDLVERALALNLTALTWVGVAILIYSGYALATQIETSFDDITGRRRRRSFFKRLAAYWVALTAGPLLLGAGFLVGSHLWAAVRSAVGDGAVVRLLWDFLLTTAALVWAYSVLPTLPLAIRSNITGALAGAVILLAAKWGFSKAIIGIGTASLMYGSAGALTLFMLWVYVMWLGALYGLQVAALIPASRRGDADPAAG